jgi:glucose/mannose-6-phosphate isomerase
MDLDDLDLLRQVDTQDMIGHINALPDQLRAAWAYAKALDLPAALSRVWRVVVCGMGGSAIGGELLAAVGADECQVPIIVHRAYDLPACVSGADTLVIAISHSGNTEETLAAFESAQARGARLLAITTGGQLAEAAHRAGATLWAYGYDSQPRAALGYIYGLLLAAASRLGLMADKAGDVLEAARVMRQQAEAVRPESPVARNSAKRLAGQLVGRIPVIYGAGLLAPVARRWKTQLNENGKQWAHFEVLPELNHNAVCGIMFPAEVLMSKIFVLHLLSPLYDGPRIARRHQATRQLLMQEGINTDVIEAHGQSRLAQQMTALHFGDYVSFYVAMANRVDPTPITPIDILKESLLQED